MGTRMLLPLAMLAATAVAVASKQTDSPEVGVPWLYQGLMVWAFFWAFLDAYTIGANDVANAFANAVGAGTLTHRQACLIACVFEFIGVVALGKRVTDTIRKKMVKVDLFNSDPYVLALGMSMVNVGSGGWVLIATLLSMPVSTTHSVVGATLGIGIAAFGTEGVEWRFEKKGFLAVVASWFISPVLSGLAAATIYMSAKILVLKYPTDQAIQRGLMLMPVYLFFTFGVIFGFMFMKGIPAMKKTPYEITVPLTVGLAAVFAFLGVIFVVPWQRRTIVDRENLPWFTMAYTPCVAVGQYGYYTPGSNIKDVEKPPMQTQAPMQQPMMPMQQPMMPMQPGMMPMQPGMMPMQPGMMPMQPGMMPIMGSAFGADEVGKSLAPGFYQDVGARREEDAAMHAKAFIVEDDVELMFVFPQLISCCFFSLSHGANDVANAVGPFATVWAVHSTGTVGKKNEVPIWLLIYGGIALDIGLLTMGHIIMSALGNRITLQTPSRGFAIELGAMFVVMIASRIGIPVSTTHCISGATIAVGLCNGSTAAVNLVLICIIFFGWVITCPSAGLICGLMFWGIASSPKPMEGNGFFTGKLPSE
jgi:phosphate/sulfate permease